MDGQYCVVENECCVENGRWETKKKRFEVTERKTLLQFHMCIANLMILQPNLVFKELESDCTAADLNEQRNLSTA